MLLACAVLLDRVARAPGARFAAHRPVCAHRAASAPAALLVHSGRPRRGHDAVHAAAGVVVGRDTPARPRSVPWYVGLAIAYVAVAVVFAVRAIVRQRQLARTLASAQPLHAIEAPCPVLCHAELGPMVVGLFAPRIVLPQALLDEASRPVLACISRHEAAHVRRRDPWLVVGMEALLVVAWPVLPLWVAAARVRHLIELACDEAALENADAAERRRYGHLLLDVAEQRPLAFSGAGLHFASTLRARIEAIALQRPWPRALQATLVATAVAGFAACSSAAPSTVPQGTGGSGAANGGLDEYGYKYETDPFRASPKMDALPGGAERNAGGRLAPEVIQNVVRQNFGRFRTCYEEALKRKPKLEGTVTVKYAIEPNGSTQGAADEGSTLPDLDAIQCVVHGFSALSYPPPQGGYVTVVYPIAFSPGD